MKPHPLPIKFLAASVLGLAVSASAQQAMMDYDPYSNEIVRKNDTVSDWTQHVRLSGLVGLNINAKFSDNGAFNINNSAAKGIYDDGYVHPDQSGDTTHTGFWGYNNASQFDSTAQTMTFHSASSFTGASSSSEESGVFGGGEISYGGDNFWNWKRLHVGWDAGLGIMPINIQANSPTRSANVNVNEFTYDTTGMTPPTISLPYQGGPSGSGEPLLPTTFTSSSTNFAGTVASSSSLNVMFLAFRLGPTLRIDLTRHFSVYVGAGPALGLVTGYYRFNETITYQVPGTPTPPPTVANSSGRQEFTDFVYGGYVNAMLSYRIQDVTGPADIFIGAQYMPMTDAKFSQGGREADLSLKGQIYITAGLSWPF